ncbi:MAG: aromatic amino acid transport family protein [Candidatus Paceibacterota bacterium]|jgi:amino acid permease
MKLSKNSIFALFILIGTIVGAGMFGLPYVFSRSGILPALFYFPIIAGLLMFLHLAFGEIFLRTKEECRLVGLARKYLGKNYGRLATFSVVVGLIGSLLAYIILEGQFLSTILSGFGVSAFDCSIIFVLLSLPLIFRGLKVIAPMEIFTNVAFFIIIIFILIVGLPKVSLDNFSLISLPDVFLPYGVILFSLVGFSAVAEAESVLRQEEKKNMKSIIKIAFLIITVLYILFSFVVVGVSGDKTSQDVFSGLSSFLGPGIIFFGTLAAFITVADSYLVVAIYLKNSLICDQNISKVLASIFVGLLPVVLFILGVRNFIGVIGFLGTVIGVIEGIIIILLFNKSKTLGDHNPEYAVNIPKIVLFVCALVLVLGAVLQFII